MNIWLDFETYYDKTYSLKNMSIEAYIRDPRFEPLLLAVAIDDGPVCTFLPDKIPLVLAKLPMQDPANRVYAHNAKFDISIIEMHYGIHVANPVCTYGIARWSGMSRVCREGLGSLAEALGVGVKGVVREQMIGKHLYDLSPQELQAFVDYGKNDVVLMRAVVQKLLSPGADTEAALDFISMTTRMYTQAQLVLDVPLLHTYREYLIRKIADDRIRVMRWFQFDDDKAFLKAIRSAKTFTAMLASLGVEVPIKISEARTKTARRKAEENGIDPATVMDIWIPALAKDDLEFTALLDHPDERVAALVQARLGSNSSANLKRCETFLNIASRGTLPVPLEPYRAHTGRYSAGTVDEVATDAANLQNLGKRKGDKTLRKAICAPEGAVLVAADSAQVEARVGAWITQEIQLLELFQQGGDPYCQFAGVIYGLDPQRLREIAKELVPCTANELAQATFHRNVGKEGVLSSQYQIGFRKFGLRLLQNGIRLADGDFHYAEAQRINRLYRATFTCISGFWDVCENILVRLMAGENGTFGGPQGETFRYFGRQNIGGREASVIYLPDGFPLVYHNLRMMYDTERKRWQKVYDRVVKGKWQTKTIYGGLLFENLTQALAFSAMRYQVGLVKSAPIVMNSHDEWVALAPIIHADIVSAELARCMRTAPPWGIGIPFDCDQPKIGRNYGEM